MRIAELSRRSGVPVATIKFYLREGLLRAGQLTSRNQADYDEQHLRRLRLVRALIEVGRLPIVTTRELLGRIEGKDLLEILGKALYALARDPRGRDESVGPPAATGAADALIRRRRWRVRATNPARQKLADVLASLEALGQQDFLELLDDYADAAAALAKLEVRLLRRRSDLDGIVEGVVVATVLGDVLLSSIRRLAEEDAGTRAFAPRHDGLTKRKR